MRVKLHTSDDVEIRIKNTEEIILKIIKKLII